MSDGTVYLRLGLNGEDKIWKIGQTDDLKSRNSSSKSCGSLNTLVHSFPGDVITEKALHLFFKDYAIPGEKELFEHSDYIKKMFIEIGENKKILYEYLWNNKYRIFNYNNIYRSSGWKRSNCYSDYVFYKSLTTIGMVLIRVARIVGASRVKLETKTKEQSEFRYYIDDELLGYIKSEDYSRMKIPY